MNNKLVTSIAAVTLSAFLLTGCSLSAGSRPDPEASAAAAPAAEATTEPAAEPAPEAPANPLIKAFGEVITYEDGVSISVSPAAPFTPTEYAAGAETGTPVIFTVVITNNSAEPLEPLAFPTVSSGGQQGSSIFDIGNPEYGDIGMFPTTTLLPGQTIQWISGFAVANPADVTFEVSPSSFLYEDAIFTTLAG